MAREAVEVWREGSATMVRTSGGNPAVRDGRPLAEVTEDLRNAGLEVRVVQMMDKIFEGVESLDIQRGTDGSLILQINPAGTPSCILVKLERADQSADHPVILVGRGVEVALVRGLNEGEKDSDPRCDIATSVLRDPTTGELRTQTNNEEWKTLHERTPIR